MRFVVGPLHLGHQFSFWSDQSKKGICACGEILGTAKSFNRAIQLVHDLKPVNDVVNVALKHLSPNGAASLEKLNQKLEAGHLWYKALSSSQIDILQYHGRSIAVGRQTPRHPDPNGPPGELVCILSLGQHTGGPGGALYVSSLNMIIPFPPGTFIFLRGGELLHEILSWAEGQRYSITHFTHQ